MSRQLRERGGREREEIQENENENERKKNGTKYENKRERIRMREEIQRFTLISVPMLGTNTQTSVGIYERMSCSEKRKDKI